jgi:uncharacterized protein (DUF2249 family)
MEGEESYRLAPGMNGAAAGVVSPCVGWSVRPRDLTWLFLYRELEEYHPVGGRGLEEEVMNQMVDARPTLAAGGEPFNEIMEAAGLVDVGEELVVYAPFEPVPLEGVLGEQGFTYVADELEGGDWKVTFSRM